VNLNFHYGSKKKQAKNQFSWRFGVSKVRKCAYLNFEFLTVFQYFHSFYGHGSKKAAGKLDYVSLSLRRRWGGGNSEGQVVLKTVLYHVASPDQRK